jgi:hypothetical protein
VKRTAQGSVPVKIGLCLFIAIFSQSEVNMLSNPTKAKIAVPKYSASYLIEVLPELYIDEPSKRSLVTLRTFLSSRINPRQPATCRSTP